MGARGEQGWAGGDFGGGEKTLDSRLQTAGMTGGETGGNKKLPLPLRERVGVRGASDGDRREGRKGPRGKDGGGPAGIGNSLSPCGRGWG